jgi:hypothetical protein
VDVRILLCILLAVGAVSPIAADCQGLAYPLSQRASVSQNVALTTITVTYGRPFARGRVLFSELIPWDKIWHPGADSATIIKFSKDVQLEGKSLAAGEYSLWLIPRESAPWTLILSKAAHVFHQPYPGENFDALRIDVQPERGGHMEAMAFYFPEVNRENAVLRLHWGDRIVPLKIRATP